MTALVLRLSTAERAAMHAEQALPYAVADLIRENDELVVMIQGSPNAKALLLANGQPVRIVQLDGGGRGRAVGEELAAAASLEIAVLAEAPEVIPPLPTRTPIATLTHTATPTATPTATASATASPTATRTSSPTASAARPRAVSPQLTPPWPPQAPHPKTASPTNNTAPPVLHLVTDAGPKIAITFDGNVSSNGTTNLLETLQELDLEITLFVTGGFVERHPNLVRRAVLAGHEVGNHSYTHPHLTSYADNHRHDLLPNITKAEFQSQLLRTETAFRQATGRSMAPLWRAPYGEENPTLRSWAMELGYLHVRWSSLGGKSLDSLDWIADEHSRLYHDSRRMVDRLLQFPRLEGGIVLMHLSTQRDEPPWIDLPRFIDELRRRGIDPVKVSTLLTRSATWKPWYERALAQHEELFGE